MSEKDSQLTDAEFLATLDALGELDSEDDAERLSEALEANPELAELKKSATELSDAVEKFDVPEMPAGMLAALEKNREEALDEAGKKVVPVSFFAKPAVWMTGGGGACGADWTG